MRLTKIKLAGFKSFVDPTRSAFRATSPASSDPNGCGKSNIIDAVRWVMGELSARHLRGDSMADVVFNGSSARKPVGSASVELMFDNTDGKIGGPYAGYNEVSLQAPGVARRQLQLLHQWRALPPQGHHAAVPGHGPRLAQLRDHRAGHDLAHHRGKARGHARLRRGGRRASRATRSAAARPRAASPTRARTSSACRTCAMRSKSRSVICSARPPRRGVTRLLKERERRLTRELLALRLRELDSGAQIHDSAVRARELAMQAALAEQRAAEAALEKQRLVHTEQTERRVGRAGPLLRGRRGHLPHRTEHAAHARAARAAALRI